MDTSMVNLLSLVGSATNLKRAGGTSGGEYHGPCPFCGGKDRFRVQPNRAGGGRWACRGCDRSGDAIAYVMNRDNVDFKTACERLGLSVTSESHVTRVTQRQRQPERKPEPLRSIPTTGGEWAALNDPAWKSNADKFITETMLYLWDKGGEPLDYLHQRGLTDGFIAGAELGFNPVERRERWGNTDVYLPVGHVIPHEIGGVYWKINIRQQANREPRYLCAKGSANSLYGANRLHPGVIAVLVEGEFDGLALDAALGELRAKHNIVTVATGSTSGAHLLRWVAAVNMASRVLIAFDNDGLLKGDKASVWWLDVLGDKAQRLRPTRKDITDMVKSGDDVRGWLLSALEAKVTA